MGLSGDGGGLALARHLAIIKGRSARKAKVAAIVMSMSLGLVITIARVVPASH